MRILMVHNFYRSGTPGGEDIAFAQERDLLQRAGHDVLCYTRSNDEMRESDPLDLVRTASGLHRSSRTRRELSTTIAHFRPDVAHFHNTFPLISESGFDACHAVGVPVLQTLHNYRQVCIAATHFRDGRVCEACVPGDATPGIRNRCYRNLAASALLAWSTVRNHEARLRHRRVARFFALNRFMATRLRASGVSDDRIVVKPNFISPSSYSGGARGDYILFAGRLATEKGVHMLLDAWRGEPPCPLKIVGEGPLGAELRERVRREGLPVEMLGMRSRTEVLTLLARARALVVPSIWFEGLPLSALEAFAVGVPVVAARIGGLAELIGEDVCGVGFTAGDAGDLSAAVRRVLADEALQARVTAAAKRRVEEEFSPHRSLQILESAYRDVLAQREAA